MNYKIRELREKMLLTQEQLSKYLNVSRSCYTKYELGLLDMHIDVLIKLCKIFNISLEELVNNKTK